MSYYDDPFTAGDVDWSEKDDEGYWERLKEIEGMEAELMEIKNQEEMDDSECWDRLDCGYNACAICPYYLKNKLGYDDKTIEKIVIKYLDYDL